MKRLFRIPILLIVVFVLTIGECLAQNQDQLRKIALAKGKLTTADILLLIEETRKTEIQTRKLIRRITLLDAINSQLKTREDTLLPLLGSYDNQRESMISQIALLKSVNLRNRRRYESSELYSSNLLKQIDSLNERNSNSFEELDSLRLTNSRLRYFADSILKVSTRTIDQMIINSIRREVRVLALLTPKKRMGRWQPSGYVVLDEDNSFMVKSKKIESLHLYVTTGAVDYENLPKYSFTLRFNGNDQMPETYIYGAAKLPVPISFHRGSTRRSLSWDGWMKGTYSLQLYYDESNMMTPILSEPYVFRID